MSEVDLTQVDWNKLSISEFHGLEKKMQSLKAIAKDKKGKRCSGRKIVKIRGKVYEIKEVTYQRLKSLKSDKSKQKLIDEIISTHNPIESY